MLLSHNFNVSEDVLPSLSREEFTKVFIQGLANIAQCRLIDNPHWIVEVLFDPNKFSAAQIGESCAQALINERLSQVKDGQSLPNLLILGGIKTTPPTSASPDALQPGEWGVDVVETANGNEFLQAIGWDATVASKPPENVFKVERA
ncbi:hypothetical protein Cal6303_0517 [Calothrix sp. PCC 6303]|nr:hypothetical protein Cal6303_0517 [Calothrix sp. PCC 6303]